LADVSGKLGERGQPARQESRSFPKAYISNEQGQDKETGMDRKLNPEKKGEKSKLAKSKKDF